MISSTKWMDDALCATIDDSDIFFSDDPDEQQRARAICGECPVRAQCLDHGFSLSDHHSVRAGVAGLTRKNPYRFRYECSGCGTRTPRAVLACEACESRKERGARRN